MSIQAAYAAVGIFSEVNFATANTNRDGTGTIATLVTSRPPGTRIERVRVRAAGTTTAGVIRIFKLGNGITFAAPDASGGYVISSFSAGTLRLIHEILVTAITPSATIASWTDEWAPTNGITLGPYERLGISTHNAETFNAFAIGGHL